MFIGAILIPFYKDWGGLKQVEIQTLQSVFLVTVLLMEIPTGFVADYFGRKISVALGPLLWVFGIIVYSLEPDIRFFIAGEIILAIGNALTSGADQAIIYDSLKALGRENEATKIITRGQSIKMLGMVFGNLIGAILAKHLQYNHIFVLTAITQFAAFAVALAYKEPPIENKSETKKWNKILTQGVTNVARNKNLRILSFDLIYIATLSYFTIWLYQSKLEAIGAAIGVFGILSVVLPLNESVVHFFQNNIEKIVGGKRNYIRFSIFLVSIGFILGGLLNNVYGVVVLILLAGGFGLTRMPYYITVINKQIASENRATSISTINLFKSLAIAIVNPFFGYTADINLNTTLIFIGILAIAGYFISNKATKFIEE